ncbi:MAG: DNA replication/repair protein RecF [Pseudomonadales bacterium]|nr:DNA replication/repair protein RecF [Pseudomonadales bacterium]
MSLKWLEARHFRNLTHISVDLDPGLNLLFGENGSGKTSLLESSYFLSTARSFRDTGLDSVIQRGAQDCLLRGKVQAGSMEYHIGISRNRGGRREIKINSETTRKSSELARLLPTLILGPHSVDLLIGSPTLRRRFLNWGLFHVKPGRVDSDLSNSSFMATGTSSTDFPVNWEEANRCLRQRNMLLRRYATNSGVGNLKELETWSDRLATYANQIDLQRTQYVELYRPLFTEIVQQLAGIDEVTFDYYRGWHREADLMDIYLKEADLDQKRGFTQKGFQRADVRITVSGQPAAKVCSRGELKSLVWAMILAQGALASDTGTSEGGMGTLYLVDDLASEFDEEHRRRVCKFLVETGQQVLLTGVEEKPLLAACKNQYGRLFHVKHGELEVQEH